MNNICVYRHRRLDTNEIFYIGISNNNYRPFDKRRNIIWKRIVEKTNYIVEIIYSDLEYDKACELEMFLIKEYGRKDLNTGSLANLTDGGEGPFGYIQSKETINKRILSIKGKKRSPEICEKLCLINSKKVINIKTKKVIKNAKTLSKLLNIDYSYLTEMLRNKKRNVTEYKYLKDINNKNIKCCQKQISPNRKVIDVFTNIIYESVAQAALKNNINKNTLSGYLKNKRPNKTNLRFYEENNT